MNIQALSDTELNRAMIWLYPKNWKDVQQFCEEVCYWDCASEVHTIDFLSDWNLVMPLAVENGVALINDGREAWAGTDISVGMDYDSSNKNPLRAICLVLVQLRLDG